MKEIWSNEEYRKHHAPPIIAGWPAAYGEKQKNVVFWYLYTPTGRVSKFWHYAWAFKLSHEEIAEKYEPHVYKAFEKRLKMGYSVSKPYRY